MSRTWHDPLLYCVYVPGQGWRWERGAQTSESWFSTQYQALRSARKQFGRLVNWRVVGIGQYHYAV